MKHLGGDLLQSVDYYCGMNMMVGDNNYVIRGSQKKLAEENQIFKDRF
jgi:hypothetical protein